MVFDDYAGLWGLAGFYDMHAIVPKKPSVVILAMTKQFLFLFQILESMFASTISRLPRKIVVRSHRLLPQNGSLRDHEINNLPTHAHGDRTQLDSANGLSKYCTKFPVIPFPPF